MTVINLSVFNHNDEVTAVLREMLAEIERRERITVNLEVLEWRGGWNHMVLTALHRAGHDVSEIGTTWTQDFVKMNALYALTPLELREIGSPDDFVPEAWASVVMPTSAHDARGQIWAIPWSGDTRGVFYRRDMLAEAGIDAQTAFATIDDLLATLARLQAAGAAYPLSLMTMQSRVSVHILASFIWAAGGQFTGGANTISFDSPEARRGMAQYFSLGRFLPPDVQQLTEDGANALFASGKAATALSGFWAISPTVSNPQILPKISMTRMPGVPFVGGMNLAIWQHASSKRDALKLIRFLTDPATAGKLYPDIGIAVHKGRLAQEPYLSDPNHQALRQSMLEGQSFSSEQLWGVVEKRLTDVIPIIWQEVFAAPDQVDAIIEKHILPLAKRLNLALKS
jgi:ABC-type glycerol-3-phosphate transport system substrate-binding protein